MVAELEALRARNTLLEEDNSRLKEYLPPPDSNSSDQDFESMSLQQLRDYIATNSGHPPEGALNRRTLIRMARDLKAAETAA